MLRIDPNETQTKDFHQYLLGSVAPRPIAFVSTINKDGLANLAPYSFFNAFSSNPPILVFSSNRRVSDNTTKDTLANVIDSKDLVINVVNHAIVRQMAIASIQFDANISEFDKTGLTKVPSEMVKSYRVKESPVQMECKVEDIITLGEHGGAGHLIICRVLLMHIDENIVDDGRIDPHKADLMGRMGRAYYVRASGPAIQTIVQPVTQITIGYDGLPEYIRFSKTLTGNEIGLLAGIKKLPSKEEISDWLKANPEFASLVASKKIEDLEESAKELLKNNDVSDAISCLMIQSLS